MTGVLDMQSNSIKHLKSPADYSDASNKSYVDTNVTIKIGNVVDELMKTEGILTKICQ